MPQPASAPAAPRLPGWQTLEALGEGAQSHVWLVRREGRADAPPAVAKVMRLIGDRGYPIAREEQRWRVLREAAALTMLQAAGCAGAVRLLDHGPATVDDPRPWLVMPRHPLGSIRWFDGVTFRYREPLQGRVSRVAALTGALARTLAVMHAHTPRILHRDVHLGNVLLDRVGGPPVLGDFGSADVEGFAARPETETPIFSTPWLWRAPELDAGEPPSAATDVYMLGGVIYEGLSGGHLLPSLSRTAEGWMHEAPENALSRFTADPRIATVNALLRTMFSPEPAERPGAGEVAHACGALLRAPGPPDAPPA